MIGLIAGDIIGSIYEYPFYKGQWDKPKPYQDFKLFQKGCRFTDDTTMSLAIAAALLEEQSYEQTLYKYGNEYWGVGYGGNFKKWLKTPFENIKAYHSFGNGSAMRVNAIGWAFDTEKEVLAEAKKTALPTHNHPEGIKGAEAVALAVFMARMGCSKEEIKHNIQQKVGYELERKPIDIRPSYTFDVTCQGSVPESIICFLASKNLEDAIRLAISLGGDTDTMAAIAGGIAAAYYQAVPKVIYEGVQAHLDKKLWAIVQAFEKHYHINYQLI
ncbi:ADP-ribosylglycohydrolase family protein [Aureispira anguillae]|uniref:ADP-ribosylglycohydrolase family protein n=1 Tax=Aureispira anguillae TaxID=2864201 RepID=A0A915YBR0_9BACT|nr:ADP-ribosylglycohydrolase family protein [Aureispira anguillae]BDS10156.1 ADP-ribosylglycohydrolase family protein [Aureispira anguillae]